MRHSFSQMDIWDVLTFEEVFQLYFMILKETRVMFEEHKK